MAPACHASPLGEQRLESVEVDGPAPLLGDLAAEVDRESERVVQEEGFLAKVVA